MRLWRQLGHALRRRNFQATHVRRQSRWHRRRHGAYRKRRQSLGKMVLRRLRRLFVGDTTPRLMHGCVIAYHGTPSASNARSILHHGFMAGGGNALGDGIYLATNVATAKSHAGSAGVYLKCAVRLGRTCFWGPGLQARYAAWCEKRGVRQDNSAITGFLVQNGYNTLQNDEIVVVLIPQFANPTAWKRKTRQIKVLSIHRATDDKKMHV